MTLKEYLIESLIVNEGGMAGHMAHPIDFADFTAADLKELISDLFEGRIEDITEKIDGNNVQATMREDGTVLFLRNNKDLNNVNGGMTIEDMATKWADKPSVSHTYITAGQIITKVFSKIDPKFFNPEPNKKLAVNCECVIAGVTNIIPYADAQVDFHDIYIYVKSEDKWELEEVTKKGLDVINKACDGLDDAKLTPKVIIDITKESNALIKKYHKMIDDLFDDDNVSIDGWKFVKFCEHVDNKYPWILDNPQGSKLLYNRWFKGDKSTNIKVIRQIYVDHANELNELDKKVYKDIVSDVIDPLDNIFIKLGNDIIRLCKGLINGSSNDGVIKHLQSEMQTVIKDVKANGTSETQAKLVRQLQRIENAGGESSINSVEGIVFKYKGRLMKLTGSFAPLNQILGTIKFSR
jgi:hypothetical protein